LEWDAEVLGAQGRIHLFKRHAVIGGVMKKKFSVCLLMLGLLGGSAGCGESETVRGESTPTETPGPVIDPSVDLDSLSGTVPLDPKPMIEFTALNFDGNSRTQLDLTGQRTVLWFFPLANSPG